MLNAAWRGAGRLGVAEKVGEADFGLDDVGVRVGSQAHVHHERGVDRLSASERAAECGDFFVARNPRKTGEKSIEIRLIAVCAIARKPAKSPRPG